jgi:hypothetical protein
VRRGQEGRGQGGEMDLQRRQQIERLLLPGLRMDGISRIGGLWGMAGKKTLDRMSETGISQKSERTNRKAKKRNREKPEGRVTTLMNESESEAFKDEVA